MNDDFQAIQFKKGDFDQTLTRKKSKYDKSRTRRGSLKKSHKK